MAELEDDIELLPYPRSVGELTRIETIHGLKIVAVQVIAGQESLIAKFFHEAQIDYEIYSSTSGEFLIVEFEDVYSMETLRPSSKILATSFKWIVRPVDSRMAVVLDEAAFRSMFARVIS